MAWWSRKNKAPEFGSEKRSVPSGLFQKCDGCATTLDSQKIVLALRCCPQCGHHFTMPTEDRIRLLLDEGTAVEQDTGLGTTDPLGFRDTKSYAGRLSGLNKSLGRAGAFRSFVGKLAQSMDPRKVKTIVYSSPDFYYRGAISSRTRVCSCPRAACRRRSCSAIGSTPRATSVSSSA